MGKAVKQILEVNKILKISEENEERMIEQELLDKLN